MKKYFYSLLAATGLLLATSCSQDDLVNETGSESKVVTFKVNLPDQATSRAVGDGTNATELIFAMYEEDTDVVLIAKDTKTGDAGIKRETNGTFSITVPMAKDIKYDLLFLAYNPINSAFKINESDPAQTNLKALEFKNKLTANLDAYDAFVGQLLSQGITESKQTTVTLYRPFAQINAGTTNADFLAAKDTLKSEIKTSSMTIYNVPGTYNVETGVASDSIDVVFEQSAIPSDVLNVAEKDYKYLALAYVLAKDSTETSLHQADFAFQREGSKQVSSLSFLNFPIQRNYRTNVVGRLLTDVENYTVEIDNEFGTVSGESTLSPDVANRVYQVATDDAWKEVADILASEGKDTVTVKLGAGMGRAASNEIAVTIPTTIHKDKTVFLDLNGYTLSHTKECSASYQMINNEGTLTIVDSSEGATGKISFKDTGNGDPNFKWGSYTIRNNGTLVVENGTIEHLGEQAFATHAIFAIYQYSGSTTINGGTISTPNYRSARLWKGDMTINGGKFDGQVWVQAVDNTSELTINGGTFAPNGNDASSVFVENKTYDVAFAVTGGTFQTKIGCSDATKLAGCITGGTFTDEAKEKTAPILFRTIISTAEDLVALSGKAINGICELAANIDMTGKEMKPIQLTSGASNFLTFEGNGHTISNLTLVQDYQNGMYVAGLFNILHSGSELNVKKLKLENVTSTSDKYAAALVAYNSTSLTINLEDVDVNNATISAETVAALVGYTTGKVNLTDCDVTNLTLTGEEGRPDKVGALVGTANTSTCAVITTNCTNNTTYGDYGRVINDATWNGAKFMTASTQEGLNKIVSSGNNVKMDLGKGNYQMPDGSEGLLQGKTITISGTKETVIDARNVDTNDQFVTGATLVFDGVTLNFNDGSGNIYMGFANTKELIYKNCKIIGMQFLYGEKVTFENCILDSSANTGEPHAVWTYGAKNISFSECEFIYGNRAINCYKDQDIDGGKQVVNFNKCKFTTAATDSKGAVEINSSAFSVGIEVNLTGCTAPAYGEMAYVSEWDSTNGAKTTINIK